MQKRKSRHTFSPFLFSKMRRPQHLERRASQTGKHSTFCISHFGGRTGELSHLVVGRGGRIGEKYARKKEHEDDKNAVNRN